MSEKEIPKSEKSPYIETFLNNIAINVFGRSRTDLVCVTCGSRKISPEDFRDDLSRKEFAISRMCQECQDSVFGK